MARFRTETIRSRHDLLGNAIPVVTAASDADAPVLAGYVARHAVGHLLLNRRVEDAERAMLDVPFMAAFCDAWPDVVEPLAAWRVIGLDRARHGYGAIADALPQPMVATKEDIAQISTIQHFLDHAGITRCSHALGAWCLKVATVKPGSMDLGDAMRNQAISLFRSGEPNEAHRLLQAALDHFTRKLGPQDEQTLSIAGDLGVASSEVGAHDAALVLLESTLTTAKTFLGSGHEVTLKALNNLSALHHREGNLLDAKKYADAARVACEQQWGTEDVRTLTADHNLANVLMELEDFEEAERVCRQTLAARNRLLGRHHPHSVLTYSTLGSILHSQGRLEEAADALQDALRSSEEIHGHDARETTTIINNLALVLEDLGSLQEAEALIRRDIDACSRTLGEEHPDTIVSMANLAKLLTRSGRHVDAEGLWRRVLVAQEETLGTEHPKSASTRLSLAEALEGQSRHTEAVILLESVLSTRIRRLGPTHFDTVSAAMRLCDVLERLGRSPDAERLYRHTLKRLSCSLGPGHPGTLAVTNNLAWLLLKQHKYKAAANYFRDLAQHWRDPTDWSSAWARLGRGLALHNRGGAASKALARLIELLGPEHERVGRAREIIKMMRAEKA